MVTKTKQALGLKQVNPGRANGEQSLRLIQILFAMVGAQWLRPCPMGRLGTTTCP